jgi:DNA-binding NarL/FixJ family response regulator
MSETIRVLVVDDQALVREGIASLLKIQPGIEVVGTAEDGHQAVSLTTEYLPDLVLMDIRMPGMDGIDAAKAILGDREDIKILMLTTLEDEEYIVKSLSAGACGYLLKDIPASDLAQAIRLAHKGIYQLAPTVAGKLVQFQEEKGRQVVQDEVRERIADLTPRELDVLRLIGTGAINREIADTLYLSEGTVKNVVSNIFGKLGVHDRVQAAIAAIRGGLVE